MTEEEKKERKKLGSMPPTQEQRIEAARKAILKLDKFSDTAMDTLLLIVGSMLSENDDWNDALERTVLDAINADTCLEDVARATGRLALLKTALAAVRNDVASSASVKSMLLEAFHYIDAQFRSSGAYRSSSMGYTYKSAGSTAKVEVAMGVDVNLVTGGVNMYDTSGGKKAHGIRFGSIAVEKCVAEGPDGADGAAVDDVHCDCRQVGVGPDRVVLSGVVVPEGAKDADGVVATTKYVKDACANVTRVNQNYYTGFDVVDADSVLVVQNANPIARYGDLKEGVPPLIITLPTTTPSLDSAVDNTEVNFDLGPIADAHGVNASITTTAGTSSSYAIPFLVRIKPPAQTVAHTAPHALYSVVLGNVVVASVSVWQLQITKVARNAAPVDNGTICVGKGLEVDADGCIALSTKPITFVSEIVVSKPAPRPPSEPPAAVIATITAATDKDGKTCLEALAINAKCLHIKCKVLSDSDERLKGDIRTLPDAMQMCRSMRGVEFKWHDEEKGRGYQMGVVAQEVREIYPSLVEEMDGGHLGVDYAKLVGLLIEAVKELDAEVARLRRMLEPA